MENFPSYDNSFQKAESESLKKIQETRKPSTVASDPSSTKEPSKNEAYYGHRHIAKQGKIQVRRFDPVYVKEVRSVSDYVRFFEGTMHPKLQLHIKGPLANLCFSFKADYSLQVDGKPVRCV